MFEYRRINGKVVKKTTEEWVNIDNAAAENTPVTSVKSWQAKAALKATEPPGTNPPSPFDNLYDAAIAAIEAMDDGIEKIVIQSAFENNADFESNSTAVLNLAGALGLSEIDIQDLFQLAGSLSI